MLFRFLLKRAAVLAAALSALALALPAAGVAAALGILIGTAVALAKFRLNTKLLAALCESGQGRAAAAILPLSQLFLFGLLLAAALADHRLFFGAAAGVLTVPAVILWNALTEGFALTHNRWGIREEVTTWNR